MFRRKALRGGAGVAERGDSGGLFKSPDCVIISGCQFIKSRCAVDLTVVFPFHVSSSSLKQLMQFWKYFQFWKLLNTLGVKTLKKVSTISGDKEINVGFLYFDLLFHFFLLSPKPFFGQAEANSFALFTQNIGFDVSFRIQLPTHITYLPKSCWRRSLLPYPFNPAQRVVSPFIKRYKNVSAAENTISLFSSSRRQDACEGVKCQPCQISLPAS